MLYAFGGDTNLTPEEVQRMRAIQAALAQTSTPQNVGQGVGALMQGIAGALVGARANRAETLGRKSATEAFNPILEALKSKPKTNTNVTTTTPDFNVDPANTEAAPTSIMDKSLPPVKATMENARTADRNSVQNYAGLDLKSGIKAAADSLGIKAEDLATVISYETAGTFDPLKKGPKTQWGRHRGLIQFGEPQAKEHGVDWNDPLNSQLGPDGAVVKYLRASGVKPGMELIDIYSAINAGGVNRHNATDENNGGAWGTVADKVKYQMDGHRKKALSLMAEPGTDPSAFDAQPSLKKPVEQVPVVPVPEGFEQPDPLLQQEQPVNTQPVEVAQATQAQQTMNDGATDELVNQATVILSNPWASDEQRGIAKMFLDRHFAQQQYERERADKLADPAYQMQLRKSQLELKNLENPPVARRMTDEEEKAEGLDTTGVYQMAPDGAITTIQKPKERKTVTVNGRVLDAETGETISEVPLQINPLEKDRAALEREKFEWEKTKPTQDVQEYQFYEKFERDAGRQPLGPLDWEKERRKAGAQSTTVNNNMKTEGEFEKEAAKKQAEFFSNLADEGLNARGDIEVINQLDEFLKGQGGAVTGLSGALSKWGIPFEGADDLQAADALINKLVPTQRAPGSGTMSDRDVQLFKDSLPSLWNQPGGNEKIIGVMRGMAEYKSRQGEIADMVLNGDMTRQEGRRALRELPNPLEEFRKAQKDAKEADEADKPQNNAEPAGDPDFQNMTDEELEAIINGQQ